VRLASAAGTGAGGATTGVRLNPFDLPQPALGAGGAAGDGQAPADGQGLLAEQVGRLVGLLALLLADPGQPLVGEARALLDLALLRTYAGSGITPDPATHGRPPPLLADLLAVLRGRPGALAASLAARLARYVEGALGGLFAGPTTVALDGQLVVCSLQGLDPDLRPAVLHLLAGAVWTQAQRVPRPRLLVVDEAWHLLQTPDGGAFLAGLARRARKHALGLVTLTQDVADVLASAAGRTVLVNAATVLLLKQDRATIGPLAEAFRLTIPEQRVLLGAGRGEGLLCVAGRRVPLTIPASPLEHRLATTAPHERAARASAPAAAAGAAW
jgi:hypothetical protein